MCGFAISSLLFKRWWKFADENQKVSIALYWIGEETNFGHVQVTLGQHSDNCLLQNWSRAPKSTVFRPLLIWLEKYSFKGSETLLALAMAPKGYSFSSQLPVLELWDRFPSTKVKFMIKHWKWRSAFGLCHWHFLGPEPGIPFLVQTRRLMLNHKKPGNYLFCE